jgi:superfamily I DNA/RNA helicase/RecB family exonuclease
MRTMTLPPFDADPEQSGVLDLERGALLVTGGPGTGKSAVVRERFACLVDRGADPERVALVVRTKAAKLRGRQALLGRLSRSVPGVKVLTVHGLAHHVMARRFAALDYDRPPEVLTALDQFSKVAELLEGEVRGEWPSYGAMLSLRGFADEVRQFVLRAQEALLTPEEIVVRADKAGLGHWRELAGFYGRYLQVLSDEGSVDFAGLVNQAAVAARHGDRLLDHLLVDDYQEATFAEEALVVNLAPHSLVVAGDAGSHIFSFQGATDAPLKRFTQLVPTAGHIELAAPHRGRAALRAWSALHTSEEYAAAARELRRVHVENGVPWREMAVVVRRQGSHVGGLIRALDDARVPRSRSEGGVSLMAEPATVPFVLALRWLARPEERDGLIESLLTSELAGLSPAAARGLVRSAQASGCAPFEALDRVHGLGPDEVQAVAELREALGLAERVAGRSVLDAFAILWRSLSWPRRLVGAGEESEEGRRDLDAILAFSEALARVSERGDASAAAFVELLEAGDQDLGLAASPGDEGSDGVRVLTAHGTAGLEFDTVVVVGAIEGNFPSLTRPEPMFDLNQLEAPTSQSDRNRLRLEDERRLFRVVAGTGRRLVLFTAGDSHADDAKHAAPSRFVGELGVLWEPAPLGGEAHPVSAEEAAASWRRAVSEVRDPPHLRLAALDALLGLGERPERWWFQRDWTGPTEPLHQDIRVSYSRLDTLENCALQFVLAEELGLEGQAGYYAWVGHLVHKIIEDCESGLIPRTLKGLADAAEQRWRPQEFPSFAVSEAFRTSVTERMLPAWLATYGQTAALARELRFSFEFEGATVSGYIDRVGPVQTGGSQITDYKTGKSKNAKPDDNLQLGIYFLAVQKAEELQRFLPVKAVELAYLKETRDGSVARAQLGLHSAAQREYEKRMAERLSGLIGRIRELNRIENYRPNPAANCRYCDFKILCPLWPEGKELFPVAAKAET